MTQLETMYMLKCALCFSSSVKRCESSDVCGDDSSAAGVVRIDCNWPVVGGCCLRIGLVHGVDAAISHLSRSTRILLI